MNLKTFCDSFTQTVRIVLSNGKSFPIVEVYENFEEKKCIIFIQLQITQFEINITSIVSYMRI